MKLIAALTLIAAQMAFAASTTNVTVEGMHCSGCKKIITSKVCGNPEIAKNAESCEVNLTNKEKQIGEIKIVAKENATIDAELVKKQIAAAGDDYKVASLTTSTATPTATTPATATKATQAKPKTK